MLERMTHANLTSQMGRPTLCGYGLLKGLDTELPFCLALGLGTIKGIIEPFEEALA